MNGKPHRVETRFKDKTDEEQKRERGRERWILSELLVFKFALQFLGLGHFTHGAVEVVLVYGFAVVFDGEEAAGNRGLWG